MTDPQVQMRIIDLAAKWAEQATKDEEVLKGKLYDTTIKNFDKAYKDILKTVQPPSESGGKTIVQQF
jgi:hypothetical protein